MDVRDLMTSALDRARRGGASQSDVLFRRSHSQDIEIFDGAVAKSEVNSGQGIGIRLIKDGRPGYAYTRRLKHDLVEKMVDDAIEQSALSSELEIDLPGPHDVEGGDPLGKWNPELESLGMDRLKEFCLDMEGRATSLDERLVNLPHVGASTSSSESFLMNSKGHEQRSRANDVSAYLGGVAEAKGQTKSGVYFNGGRSFSGFSPQTFAEKTVERTTELLGARPLPSGQYPVVFSNRVSASLLGMYLGALSAEMVLKGQSRFADMVDQEIGVSALTVTCDPTLHGFPGSRLLDSEGTPCRPLKLIEKGTLKTFIHNLETSNRMKVQPTGHGSRGIQGKAGVGFSNLLVGQGESSLDELLSRDPSCLYVTKLEGGAACSSVSGELSIGVQGFWVEKGERIHPVDSVTLSGNFFEVLKNIEGFSNSYQDVFQSAKVPDLLVKGLVLSG